MTDKITLRDYIKNCFQSQIEMTNRPIEQFGITCVRPTDEDDVYTLDIYRKTIVVEYYNETCDYMLDEFFDYCKENRCKILVPESDIDKILDGDEFLLRPIPKAEPNNIYCGNSIDLLKQLEDKSIDLVVTSPPYDTLRKYTGNKGDWNDGVFKQVADELYRVMKDGGVVVWVVGDKVENGSKTCTSFKQTLYFKEIGFNVNDVMIWEKTNPMPQVKQPRYSSVFEYMIVLSKGKPKTFNPIMEQCKLGGKLYDSTAKNMDGESGRHKLTYNVNKEKVAGNIWKIAVAQNKTSHPAVFPLEIPLRHIKSWSNEGDLVLDPFVGSGTTAIAAKQLNRRYIGFDISEEYCEIARKRIEQ